MCHKMISGRGIDDADLRSLALKFLRDTLTDAVCTTGDDDDFLIIAVIGPKIH